MVSALFLAEMVGFEPTHRLLGLPHFECGLLSHLSTSPYSLVRFIDGRQVLLFTGRPLANLLKQYNTDYEESQVCGII